MRIAPSSRHPDGGLGMAFLISFLARRLAQGLLIVLIVSFAIFTVLRLVPGDPARLILGPMASDAVVEQAAKTMGLRDSIPRQYLRWLAGAARGDLGRSFIRARSGSQTSGSRDSGGDGDKAPVLGLLAENLPMTLQLAGLALVFAALIALPLGVWAGLNEGRWPDKLVLYLGSAFVSIPNFWLAIVLALVVTAQLGWIPSIGYEGFSYTILPAFVIAIEMSPLFMRSVAISIAAAKRQNFVALAEIRGLGRRQVFPAPYRAQRRSTGVKPVRRTDRCAARRRVDRRIHFQLSGIRPVDGAGGAAARFPGNSGRGAGIGRSLRVDQYPGRSRLHAD